LRRRRRRRRRKTSAARRWWGKNLERKEARNQHKIQRSAQKRLEALEQNKVGGDDAPTLWRPRRAASCSASLLRRKRPDSTEVPSGRRKVHANMGVVCSPGSTWSNPSAPTLTPGCRNNSPGSPPSPPLSPPPITSRVS
jgi:hypothetical protein